VNRDKVWEILDRRGCPKHLINILGNIYNGIKVKIELDDGRISQEIIVDQGVRQGCSLSPMSQKRCIHIIIRNINLVYTSFWDTLFIYIYIHVLN
jgi:hypothetical protein